MAACQGQVHAFDSQDLVDVYLPDGPETIIIISPVFLNQSLVQVKREEISLQTLHQSLSLKRVRVKKESRSPSLRILLGPPCQQRLPPHQQSLTYDVSKGDAGSSCTGLALKD
ncbi:predicted protein [Postia placenta Mad-698-R]|uniref:Uncharacterized protein n=1 Tax=Postia placenta MAD-698-R-SB12 TaxID=670580 RepID=A0A1X6MH74_9APHY|nr:hypothetical protein POSPLADRAFT_1163181 [Postia placenta MAD-698-R-SB12]EED79748.1 predicted protein [Postia placenta Mad-698-R]EED85935.1 predicted protein [Postia placenta Mad-698-R]OSX55781.1 hypothetical protein POSPLADRAFT_1163181 [Postia placenta MAD-698-R-SB12]